MNIRFSATAKTDLGWFRRYYGQIFPEGGKTARIHFTKALQLIQQHLQIGHLLPEAGLRELSISKTPFSIIYRVTTHELIIVRVLDQRAQRPVQWDA